MDRQKELLNLYELVPFHHHPLWVAIQLGQLTYEQVIRAEVQHCIRTRAGKILREEAVTMARALSPAIFEQLLETYLEECTDDASGPSHLELIGDWCLRGGTVAISYKRPNRRQAIPPQWHFTPRFHDVAQGATCSERGLWNTTTANCRRKYSRHTPQSTKCQRLRPRLTEFMVRWTRLIHSVPFPFSMKRSTFMGGSRSAECSGCLCCHKSSLRRHVSCCH